MMKKLNAMIDGGENMVLKYQLIPEDLDTLVSVRSDEDLKHMIDEHDRHEIGGSPMLRAFLFPSKPVVVVENHQAAGSEPYVLEQRYIDAINGIIRTSPRGKLSPVKAFCTTSACSSPKSNSPDGHTADLPSPSLSPFHAGSHHSGRLKMNRVRSSPSISSLGNFHSLNNNAVQQQQHDHHHHHYVNNQGHHQQAQPPHAYPSSSSSSPLRTPTPDLAQLVGGGGGMGRPTPVMTSIRGNNYYYSPSTSRPPKGYAYYDDSPAAAASSSYGNLVVERVSSTPQSPQRSIWD